MEKSSVFGKRGGAGTALLVIIMVAFVIFISLPFISTYLNSFGISLPSGQSKYVGNSTQGVVISDIRYPASVSPLSTFSVTLYVSNNLNGNNAEDITLCLDNLGVLNFTNANQYGGSPCVAINNLFAGETVPETFTLRSPSNGAYENIPYAEDVGYYLNYNYTTSFVQPVEFVSENALNSEKYPPVGSFSETAGPLTVSVSAQQPVMYGNSVGISLSVMNAETGLTLGNVDTYILMNGSIITIQNPGTYGLSTSCSLPPSLSSQAKGMQVFCLSQPLSLNGMTISFPISLTSNEQSQLQSSNSRYFETQFKVITTYKYEQNGFFPISLQAEGYS